MEQRFSINEIARQGLLKKFNGEPIRDLGQVSRIVNRLPHEIIRSEHGYIMKTLSLKDIEDFNAKRDLSTVAPQQ